MSWIVLYPRSAMRGRTSRVNSRYEPILGSGVEMPTAGVRRARQFDSSTQALRERGREGRTVRLVDLGRLGRLGLAVLERVLLALGRVPEDGVVDGRHLDVLNDAPASE